MLERLDALCYNPVMTRLRRFVHGEFYLISVYRMLALCLRRFPASITTREPRACSRLRESCDIFPSHWPGWQDWNELVNAKFTWFRAQIVSTKNKRKLAANHASETIFVPGGVPALPVSPKFPPIYVTLHNLSWSDMIMVGYSVPSISRVSSINSCLVPYFCFWHLVSVVHAQCT